MASNSLKNIINLGNSIIGVSILAMPYCFQKCGIILSCVLLIASGLLTRVTCHLLLKAAITARRRNYEFLAFHTFGPTGKLVVEIGILGFLLGSCVAFFVVIGDLGPPLAAEIFIVEMSSRLRAVVLLSLGLCVALPLGLMRKLESLTSLSALSLGFYAFLILKIFSESFSNIWSAVWWSNVVLWKSDNIFSALPIFSMALSCQPQLFEIFDTLNEPSLKRMDSAVNGAVQMCLAVYMMVGFFGYVAFYNESIPGNILIKLPSSTISELIKLGFVITVVVSFPLCLFPCRTSLHSLIFKRGGKHHDMPYSYMPDSHFRGLTFALVSVTIGIAVILPNIELVLGLTGSTIGTLICTIMPSLIFMRATNKNTGERILSKYLVLFGFFLLIMCTFSTLNNTAKETSVTLPATPLSPAENINQEVQVLEKKLEPLKIKQPLVVKKEQEPEKIVKKEEPVKVIDTEKRQEPPEPQEPVEPVQKKSPPPLISGNHGGLDPEALRKEDKVIEEEKKQHENKADASVLAAAKPDVPKHENVQKQEQLLEKIAEEQKVQKKMLEDLQRQLKNELAKHQDEPSVNPPKAKQEGIGKDTVNKVPNLLPPADGVIREELKKPLVPPAVPEAVINDDVKKPVESMVQVKENHPRAEVVPARDIDKPYEKAKVYPDGGIKSQRKSQLDNAAVLNDKVLSSKTANSDKRIQQPPAVQKSVVQEPVAIQNPAVKNPEVQHKPVPIQNPNIQNPPIKQQLPAQNQANQQQSPVNQNPNVQNYVQQLQEPVPVQNFVHQPQEPVPVQNFVHQPQEPVPVKNSIQQPQQPIPVQNPVIQPERAGVQNSNIQNLPKPLPVYQNKVVPNSHPQNPSADRQVPLGSNQEQPEKKPAVVPNKPLAEKMSVKIDGPENRDSYFKLKPPKQVLQEDILRQNKPDDIKPRDAQVEQNVPKVKRDTEPVINLMDNKKNDHILHELPQMQKPNVMLQDQLQVSDVGRNVKIQELGEV